MTTAPLSNNPRPIDLHRERIDDLTAAADEWLAKVSEITDEATAGRAVDFDEQLLKAWQAADKERADERKPYADAAAAVQEAFKPILERALICRNLIGARLRVWKAREQRRVDAERVGAERIAADARRRAQEAARLAEQPKTVGDVERAHRLADDAKEATKAAEAMPERASVRGTLSGRTRSLRREWRAEVTDLVEFFLYLQDHERAALEEWFGTMAQRAVRGGAREIPGVKIDQVEI